MSDTGEKTLVLTRVFDDGSYGSEEISVSDLLAGKEIDVSGLYRIRFEDEETSWFAPGQDGDLGRGFVR